MEYRKHTDTSKVLDWPRCSEVVMDMTTVRWQLSGSAKFDVLAAYSSAPHLEFMQADTDQAIRVFMRRWGPLRGADAGSDSLQWYRDVRDSITAVARFFAAFERGVEALRSAFSLLLVTKHPFDQVRSFFRSFPQELPVRGSPSGGLHEELREWCQQASAGELERLCIRIVEEFPITAMPSFRIRTKGRQKAVRASLFINNLHEALWWMLWEDYFRAEPIIFCEECGKVVPHENKHERKFCVGGKCAKRRADREYAKRKRRKKKRERLGRKP